MVEKFLENLRTVQTSARLENLTLDYEADARMFCEPSEHDFDADGFCLNCPFMHDLDRTDREDGSWDQI